MSIAKRLAYDGKGARRTSRGWRSEKSDFKVDDFLSWDNKELRQLERDLGAFDRDRKDGRRAIRNAHMAAIDVLNKKAAANIARAPFRNRGKRYKRGGGTVVSRTKGGKARHVRNFRDVVAAKGAFSYRTWFTTRGVVTRSWLSGKRYLYYLGPLWENGFTPAKGTEYEGSRVSGIAWRYGPARRANERRATEERMIRAMRHMLETGRPLKPRELANVV